jgi:manganese-dependent ADP-ribose/CDP-alcohol diphosphatase
VRMSGGKNAYSFGLISDVQWTPTPTHGQSFHGTPRYYADALEKAKRAVESFRKHDVDACIHLGDIVDFHASKHGVSNEALDEIIETFDQLSPKPVLHCIGNHCLYNAPRHVLNECLGIDDHKSQGEEPCGVHSYFVFRPHEANLAFFVLDGYDISILGYPPGHPNHEIAKAILEEKNPNEEKNSNNGLTGLDKRFVKFGGGVSTEQVEWLDRELGVCKTNGEKAIICSHLCIHPQTCVPTCLLYNYDDVLHVLHRYAPDVVIATFAGHAHHNGYYQDEFGIHHRVCEAVLETEPGHDCHGIVHVSDDMIEIRGFGTFASATYNLYS